MGAVMFVVVWLVLLTAVVVWLMLRNPPRDGDSAPGELPSISARRVWATSQPPEADLRAWQTTEPSGPMPLGDHDDPPRPMNRVPRTRSTHG